MDGWMTVLLLFAPVKNTLIYIKEAGMIYGSPKGKIKVKNKRTLKVKFTIVILPQLTLQMWKTKT